QHKFGLGFQSQFGVKSVQIFHNLFPVPFGCIFLSASKSSNRARILGRSGPERQRHSGLGRDALGTRAKLPSQSWPASIKSKYFETLCLFTRLSSSATMC